ncbi:MAG: bifunctional demethylmenaquinone methyltransferase/2-methoxy-6-polyprenyl-1,4-benzoquinol methylase UbiE [Desulfofustis sp.]|jgi:demethylmenaquinone methyltransferase/2-methoxy-6-polyprenyl-1,4-benzoquinol methylase|nr:bifunctional demethylmenaquinone methyltransferase/2-methoxy-6-polyprenyl-1,4-benzoquinol methylase UbiE [Desulfofustis sp.]
MGKAEGVQAMFDAIAGRYDLMNRLMTLGQDQRWRRFVVQRAGDPGRGAVLDLACGTGDIAALFCRVAPQARVLAADFSLNMLARARHRFRELPICWQACDANQLPFREQSFEAVTFGYLLRNVDDALHVLTEVRRVLVAGGRVVCLDTTPPRKGLLWPFIRFYLQVVVPALGRCIARDKAAYAYLTGSTMDFYGAEELAALFRQAGFVNVGYRRFMFGTIGVHWGEKKPVVGS